MFSSNSYEGYGGVIKNIKRIPASNCKLNCMQYYNRCMYDRGGIDAGQCLNRYRSCVSTCYYSNFHRL